MTEEPDTNRSENAAKVKILSDRIDSLLKENRLLREEIKELVAVIRKVGDAVEAHTEGLVRDCQTNINIRWPTPVPPEEQEFRVECYENNVWEEVMRCRDQEVARHFYKSIKAAPTAACNQKPLRITRVTTSSVVIDADAAKIRKHEQ